MRGWWHRGIVAFALVLCWFPGSADARDIVALLDKHVTEYGEALAGFRQVSRATIQVLRCRENGSLKDERAQISRIRALHPAQVLVIGEEPLRALAGRIKDIPVIFCMVANPAPIIAGAQNIAGVSTNIPPERLMALAARFGKHIRRIGVVYNPDESGYLIAAARKALARRHRVLEAKPVHSPLEAMAAIRKLMPKVDAYWFATDSTVRSADVIRYVFAMARRYRKPMIGASDKLVRTGSLFAYSPDNSLMGRQAATLSNRVLDGRPVASLAVEMPRALVLSVNQASFRLHGIPLSEKLMSEAGHIY